MKKEYIVPSVRANEYVAKEILAASGVIGDGGSVDIEYGGVDEDGELAPSANRSCIWDEDEE